MADVVTLSLKTENMIAEVDGSIGWMVFNKPGRRNAVSLDMWEAMVDIIDQFEADPRVRVVVLRGAGDVAFVSGADISQFEKTRSSKEVNEQYDATLERATKRLVDCSKPTIAMIRGWCIGGGMAIATCCDLRIATEGSKFGIPAARLGLGYGPTGVRALMNLIGPSFTKEIFFTARHFTAAEVREMAYVNRVVADTDLESYVRSYCATICDNAPLTIRTLKRTVAELQNGERGDMATVAEMIQTCFDSEDFIEGRRAFMEKRRPVFRGR